MGRVSALSVISLRRNGISTTSAIPTARLPRPSSANSFAYSGLVATAVVPVGSGIIPEKSPAKSDAKPVTGGSGCCDREVSKNLDWTYSFSPCSRDLVGPVIMELSDNERQPLTSTVQMQGVERAPEPAKIEAPSPPTMY